jgi:hypothetical protein
MRLFLEICLVTALIYVGWEKPFREWLPAKVTGVSKSAAASAAPAATPTVRIRPYVPPTTATPSGSWMWDPKRKGPLDPPSHKPTPH